MGYNDGMAVPLSSPLLTITGLIILVQNKCLYEIKPRNCVFCSLNVNVAFETQFQTLLCKLYDFRLPHCIDSGTLLGWYLNSRTPKNNEESFR